MGETDTSVPAASARSLPVVQRPGGSNQAWLVVVAVLGTTAVVVAPRLPAPFGPTATEASLAFVSLVVESLPFLVAGAILAAAFQRVPPQWLATAVRRHPVLAPVLAPLAGIALPLCDCGLVPLARQLHGAAGSRSVVNGFVAGAPLTNPIVVLSTVVAFPGQPGMVVGRVAVGVAVAWLVAWIGPTPGTPAATLQEHAGHDHGPDDHCEVRPALLAATGSELTRSVPTLVVGALLAGTIKAAVPAWALAALGTQPLLAGLVFLGLAIVLAICSQADAFVAAALPVGALPRLAFLVMGPMLDVRLAALYRREFGSRWVAGYAAVTVPAVLVLVTLWATWGPV